MLTYTTRRNLAGTLCGDTSATNLATLDILLNEADREIITTKPWGFRQKTKTDTTVASQQAYKLPADFGRIVNVTVTIGTTRYTPTQIKSRDEWDRLNLSTAVSSNIPQYYFVFGKTLSFFPTASSGSNTITYNYLREQKDLSIADYSTGTITTATSAGTTVVGSGTSWTAQMAGRFIRITDSNTANTGDGYWYEIASVESTTSLTLVSPYNGTSISAGTAAYVTGQTSIVPEDFQMVSVHRACENYFTYIKPEGERSAEAKQKFAEGMKRMNIELGALGV